MPRDEEIDKEMFNQTFKLLEKTSEYQILVVRLEPLVKSIISSSEEKEKLKIPLKSLLTRFEKSGERMRLFMQDSIADSDSQLGTLRKSFLFLALFETSVNNLLDCLVFLLIHNGHDFFIQSRGKYAENLKDLDASYGVAEKLEFLKLHGFSFLTQNINNSLRNKIAHMDFDIEGKGIIIVKSERFDLEKEIIKLESVVLVTARALANAGFSNLLKEES
jgi:hypothetical protein